MHSASYQRINKMIAYMLKNMNYLHIIAWCNIIISGILKLVEAQTNSYMLSCKLSYQIWPC
jgi:hypothetical protein